MILRTAVKNPRWKPFGRIGLRGREAIRSLPRTSNFSVHRRVHDLFFGGLKREKLLGHLALPRDVHPRIMPISIRRPAARDVEHGAGGERTVFRRTARRPSPPSSSTITKRPIGIFDSMKSMCCCVIWSKIAVLAAAGVTALTRMSFCASSLPSDFVRRDHAGFRGGIVRRIRVAFLAGDGSDVDDAAVVLREHRRHHRLAADEGSVED